MKVQLLISSVLLGVSSQNFPEVPGLAGWKAAIQAHAAAEGRLAPPQQQHHPAHPVPGFMNWQVQQASVLAAEKRLEEQRLFFKKTKPPPSPPSTLSTSSFASSSTSTNLASSTTTATLPSATTPTSSGLKKLKK